MYMHVHFEYTHTHAYMYAMHTHTNLLGRHPAHDLVNIWLQDAPTNDVQLSHPQDDSREREASLHHTL